MSDYADKAAEKIAENLRSCGLLARLLITVETDRIASLIRSSTPDVNRLVEAVNRLLHNSYVMVGGGVRCEEANVEELRSALSETKRVCVHSIDPTGSGGFYVNSQCGHSHIERVKDATHCLYCGLPISVKEG